MRKFWKKLCLRDGMSRRLVEQEFPCLTSAYIQISLCTCLSLSHVSVSASTFLLNWNFLTIVWDLCLCFGSCSLILLRFPCVRICVGEVKTCLCYIAFTWVKMVQKKIWVQLNPRTVWKIFWCEEDSYCSTCNSHQSSFVWYYLTT